MQLFKLFWIHLAGSIYHQICGGCGFWECDDVSHVVGAREDQHQTINTWSNSTVRGRAIIERVEEEPKSRAGFFGRHAKCFEDYSLNVPTMDTNRAARHLDA